MCAVVLPQLQQHSSPNQSSRRGAIPYLIVVHRPVGSYAGSLSWFLDPASDASAHILTGGPQGVAAQLVPWDRKAWTCEAFNAISYNVEVEDDAWVGNDVHAFMVAARIVAFLCKRTGIPPFWSRSPHRVAGVCRHADLGLAGGGHNDPTTNVDQWRAFMAEVKREWARGDFKPKWGAGALLDIAA